MIVDIKTLTIKQKSELVDKLIDEIIIESQSEEFKNKSVNNKRISGVFNTFGFQFKSTAKSIINFLKDSD